MNRILLNLLISFWKIILLFPRPVHTKLGFALGYFFYKSNMKRNRFSKANIDLCFSILSPVERANIVK